MTDNERLIFEIAARYQKRVTLYERVKLVNDTRTKTARELSKRIKNAALQDLPSMSDDEGEYDYVCLESLIEVIDKIEREIEGNTDD